MRFILAITIEDGDPTTTVRGPRAYSALAEAVSSQLKNEALKVDFSKIDLEKPIQTVAGPYMEELEKFADTVTDNGDTVVFAGIFGVEGFSCLFNQSLPTPRKMSLMACIMDLHELLIGG